MNGTHLRRVSAVLAAAAAALIVAAPPAWAPRIKGSVSATVSCDGEVQAALFTFTDFRVAGGTLVADGSLSAGCLSGDGGSFTTPVTITSATCDELRYALGDLTVGSHAVDFDADSGFAIAGDGSASLRRKLCAAARVVANGGPGAVAAHLDLLHVSTVPVQTAASV